MKAVICDEPGDESVLRIAEVASPELEPGDPHPGGGSRRQPRRPAAAAGSLSASAGRLPHSRPGVRRRGDRGRRRRSRAGRPAIAPWRCSRWRLRRGGGGARGLRPARARAALLEAAARRPRGLPHRLPQPLPAGRASRTAAPRWCTAAASGIGTAAIQLVKAAGGRIVVTAGSEEKCGRCRELGADSP